jgi:hypothetical protein
MHFPNLVASMDGRSFECRRPRLQVNLKPVRAFPAWQVLGNGRVAGTTADYHRATRRAALRPHAPTGCFRVLEDLGGGQRGAA